MMNAMVRVVHPKWECGILSKVTGSMTLLGELVSRTKPINWD